MSMAMDAATAVKQTTKVLEGFQFPHIDFESLIDEGKPCILKGALLHCPLVVAGQHSYQQVVSHLLSFKSQRSVLAYIADAQAKGRFFYNSTMTALNFKTESMALSDFFERLDHEKREKIGTAFYVGSADLLDHFPGLLVSEGLTLTGPLFKQYTPRVGIWLGNRTTAPTHYDVSNNIAACVVGRRRFTLFPPDQIVNLYPGPLEPTPGGQVVSLFDLNNPDFNQFPKARTALARAEVAELEAGDVLVYPAMWWHQVEALEDFNVMINYWWNAVPSFIDDPMNTLLHALLSLRDRPNHEKKAWQYLFDFYVFGDSKHAREHLPESMWGPLAPMDAMTARRLRVKLLKKFNR